MHPHARGESSQKKPHPPTPPPNTPTQKNAHVRLAQKKKGREVALATRPHPRTVDAPLPLLVFGLELVSPSLEGPVPPTDPKGWTVASERRHAPPRRSRTCRCSSSSRRGAGARSALRVRGGGGAVGGEASSSSSREHCAHVARARHPIKRGGRRGGGGGVCARVSCPFFPPFHLL